MSSYLSYSSSIDPALRLFARFSPSDRALPLLLCMHGWHGQVKSEHHDNIAPLAGADYFPVYPEMRGRGDSTGKPDANGWELQDAVDALAAAREHYPQAAAGVSPHLQGGSGGGGNVLGLLGKFPDLFASAVSECGISDYALWYVHDSVGEFRDEMKDRGWIGGDPRTAPEAYLARGGRTTAMNLLTPLLLVHGTDDPRVPFEQSQVYLEAVHKHGQEDRVRRLALPGVGNPGHFSGMTESMAARRRREIVMHRQQHPEKPKLPESGTLVVAGYLKTSRFEVILESIDQVALLQYDLRRSRFSLQAPSCRQAAVRLTEDPDRHSVSCRKITLAAFREIIGVNQPEAGLMA